MQISDVIGDMLTRIRNAQAADKQSLVCPYSKFREQVLKVLHSEGYIRGYSVSELRKDIKQFTIELKYVEGEGVIRKIARVSTPGKREYVGVDNMKKVANGLGINILSTSKGVMSDIQARQQGIGGELLCTVF